MSWFAQLFNGTVEKSGDELPFLFPLRIAEKAFIPCDVQATYVKILTDVIERTDGISKEVQPLMFDNCVQNESPQGLITLIATAMTAMTDMFLVWDKEAGILRLATQDEEKKIRDDYAKTAGSSLGVYISFTQYQRTQMLLIYSALEYCALSSLNKSMNLAKSIQIKINDLRASVALSDAALAQTQAIAIAKALCAGRDTYMDAKDEVITATPDTSSTEKAIAFLDAKRAYYLGMPLSYINGEQTGGIGSTGEGDSRAVERGLKNYYVSIVKPVLLALFDLETTFDTEDFRQVSTALEAAKTFDLISDDFLSRESKQKILARMFDLDPDDEQKLIEQDKLDAPPPPPVQIPPPQPVPPPTNGAKPA